MFIDTHTHFYSEQFDEDRKEAVARALSDKVGFFVLPAIDSESIPAMQKFYAEYPEHSAMMAGLHPVYVKPETYKEELAIVAKQLEEQREDFVAIGEIGIDLHWDKTTLEIQEEAFIQQIRWAQEYDLPIVIHCRKAYDETIKILETECPNGISGIFHCFGGTMQHAKRIMALGMKLGIGGVVTFKNAKLADIVAELPLEALVLETDAPYLAPTPYRGKRNESSYIPLIADKIATLHQCSIEKVAEVTTAQAKKIFNLN